MNQRPKLIIPPQEQNLKHLVDYMIMDFRELHPTGSQEEEFDYVSNEIMNLPLVRFSPEMFYDVPIINKYIRRER